MNSENARVISAIRTARQALLWRPGKADEHLAKRMGLGHLPRGTRLAEYEALIQRILGDPAAEVLSLYLS